MLAAISQKHCCCGFQTFIVFFLSFSQMFPLISCKKNCLSCSWEQIQKPFVDGVVPCKAANEAGRNDEAMHSTDRENRQTQKQDINGTGQTLDAVIHGQTDSTRSTRGKSLSGTCSGCCIFLLLQLEVLLFTWSKDFPDKDKKKV